MHIFYKFHLGGHPSICGCCIFDYNTEQEPKDVCEVTSLLFEPPLDT